MIACLARRVESVDKGYLPAVPPCLVFKHAPEFSEVHFLYGLRKLVVLKHPCNIQVLHADDLVFVNQHICDLVQVSLLPVANPVVCLGEAHPRLVAVVAALHLS